MCDYVVVYVVWKPNTQSLFLWPPALSPARRRPEMHRRRGLLLEIRVLPLEVGSIRARRGIALRLLLLRRRRRAIEFLTPTLRWRLLRSPHPRTLHASGSPPPPDPAAALALPAGMGNVVERPYDRRRAAQERWRGVHGAVRTEASAEEKASGVSLVVGVCVRHATDGAGALQGGYAEPRIASTERRGSRRRSRHQTQGCRRRTRDDGRRFESLRCG